MSPDITTSLRWIRVLRTVLRQLGLLPLGWYLLPTCILGGLGWALLQANQVLALGRSVDPVFVVHLSLGNLQALAGVFAVMVVLVDEPGRSRYRSVLAMPWPALRLSVRLLVCAGFSWLWTILTASLALALLTLLHPGTSPSGALTIANALGYMPIYMASLSVCAGAMAALIGRYTPAMVGVIASIAVVIPTIAIFWPAARFLPGVVGLPPPITSNPALSLPQGSGLALLLAWAALFSALSLWLATGRDT